MAKQKGEKIFVENVAPSIPDHLTEKWLRREEYLRDIHKVNDIFQQHGNSIVSLDQRVALLSTKIVELTALLEKKKA